MKSIVFIVILLGAFNSFGKGKVINSKDEFREYNEFAKGKNCKVALLKFGEPYYETHGEHIHKLVYKLKDDTGCYWFLFENKGNTYQNTADTTTACPDEKQIEEYEKKKKAGVDFKEKSIKKSSKK
jgi:hypothetical protein